MNIYYEYKSISLDDCEIIGKRNFSGNEIIKDGITVNSEGRRNFLLKLTEEQYDELLERGWDVGRFALSDPNRDPDFFLRVNVSYYKNPPIIHFISDGVDTLLPEDHVSKLDYVNIDRLDIIAAEVNKRKKDGTWKKKPYVLEMWATVTPNKLRERYAAYEDTVAASKADTNLDPADDGERPF